MAASPRSVAHRAFTLVELLVVIALVAVILSLVLYGFVQVQRQARSAKCLSNQRQINFAFNCYYNDNAGRFCGVDTDRNPWDWVKTP
ncbi:MAG: type II secretion system protein, partial [Planctomycetota bacterium]